MKRQCSNSIIKTAFFLVIINVISLANISAQGMDYQKEVYGNIGGGTINDDETYLGSGVHAGGGIGYRLSRRFGVDFEISSLNHKRDYDNLKVEGQALLLGGGLRFFFRPDSAEQPFLRAGLAGGRYDGTFTSKILEPTPIPSLSSTQDFFGFEIGGGLRIFVGKRWSVSPEFRLTILDKSRDYVAGRDIVEPPLWSPRFNLGVAYHW